MSTQLSAAVAALPLVGERRVGAVQVPASRSESGPACALPVTVGDAVATGVRARCRCGRDAVNPLSAAPIGRMRRDHEDADRAIEAQEEQALVDCGPSHGTLTAPRMPWSSPLAAARPSLLRSRFTFDALRYRSDESLARRASSGTPSRACDSRGRCARDGRGESRLRLQQRIRDTAARRRERELSAGRRDVALS